MPKTHRVGKDWLVKDGDDFESGYCKEVQLMVRLPRVGPHDTFVCPSNEGIKVWNTVGDEMECVIEVHSVEAISALNDFTILDFNTIVTVNKRCTGEDESGGKIHVIRLGDGAVLASLETKINFMNIAAFNSTAALLAGGKELHKLEWIEGELKLTQVVSNDESNAIRGQLRNIAVSGHNFVTMEENGCLKIWDDSFSVINSIETDANPLSLACNEDYFITESAITVSVYSAQDMRTVDNFAKNRFDLIDISRVNNIYVVCSSYYLDLYMLPHGDHIGKRDHGVANVHSVAVLNTGKVVVAGRTERKLNSPEIINVVDIQHLFK